MLTVLGRPIKSSDGGGSSDNHRVSNRWCSLPILNKSKRVPLGRDNSLLEVNCTDLETISSCCRPDKLVTEIVLWPEPLKAANVMKRATHVLAVALGVLTSGFG